MKTHAIRRFLAAAALVLALAPEAKGNASGNNICSQYKKSVEETQKKGGPVDVSHSNCQEIIRLIMGDGKNPALEKRMRDLDTEIRNVMTEVNRIKGLTEMKPPPVSLPILQRKLAEVQGRAEKIGEKVLAMVKEVTTARDKARQPNSSISAAITKNETDARAAHQKAHELGQQLQRLDARRVHLENYLKQTSFSQAHRTQAETELNQIKPQLHNHGPLRMALRLEEKKKEDSLKARLDHLQAMQLNLSLHKPLQAARQILDGKTKPNVPGSLHINQQTSEELAKIRSMEGQTTITGLKPDGTPNPTGTQPATATGVKPEDKAVTPANLTHPVGEAISEHEKLMAAHLNDRDAELARQRRAATGTELLGHSWGERTDYAKAMYTECVTNPDACSSERFGFRADRTAAENMLEGSILAHERSLATYKADVRTPEELREAVLPTARRLADWETRYNELPAFNAEQPPENVRALIAEREQILKELRDKDPVAYNLIVHKGTDSSTYDPKNPVIMTEVGAQTRYRIFQDGLNQTLDTPVDGDGIPTGPTQNLKRNVTQGQDLVKFLESPEALQPASHERDAARRCGGSCAALNNTDYHGMGIVQPMSNEGEVPLPTGRSLAERKRDVEAGIETHLTEMREIRPRLQEAIEADRLNATRDETARLQHQQDLARCVQSVMCASRLTRTGGYDYMRDGPQATTHAGWAPTWLTGNNMDNVTRLIVGKDPHAAGAYMAWVEQNPDATRNVVLFGDEYKDLNMGQRAVIRGLDDNFKFELSKAPLQVFAIPPAIDSYYWQQQMNAQAGVFLTNRAQEGLGNATFDHGVNVAMIGPGMVLSATTGGLVSGGLIAGKGALTNMDSVPVLFERGMARWSARTADNAFLGSADLYHPPAGALNHVYDMVPEQTVIRPVAEAPRVDPVVHVAPDPVVVQEPVRDVAPVLARVDPDPVVEPLVVHRAVVAEEVRPVLETPVVREVPVVREELPPVRPVQVVQEHAVETLEPHPVAKVERSELPPVEVRPEPVRSVVRADVVDDVAPHPVARVERSELPPLEQPKPDPVVRTAARETPREVLPVRDEFPRYEAPRYDPPRYDPPARIDTPPAQVAQGFDPPPNLANLMQPQGGAAAGQAAQQVAQVAPRATAAAQPELTRAANDISQQAARVTDSGRVTTPLRANDAPLTVASRTGQVAEELAPRGGTAPVSHAPAPVRALAQTAEEAPASSGLGARVAGSQDTRVTGEAARSLPANAPAPATTASRPPEPSRGWVGSVRDTISRAFGRSPEPAAENVVNLAGGPRNFFQRVGDSLFGQPAPEAARPAAPRASSAAGLVEKAPTPKALPRKEAIDDYWQALHGQDRAGRSGAERVAAAEARLRDAHSFTPESLTRVKEALLKVQPEPTLGSEVSRRAGQLKPAVESYWRALHAGPSAKARVAAAEEALRKQGLGPEDLAGLRGRLEAMPVRETIRSQAAVRELENVWKAMEAAKADGEKVTKLKDALQATHKVDPGALDSAVHAMRETDSAAEALAKLTGEGGELSSALKNDLSDLHRAVREQAAAQGRILDDASKRLAAAAKLDDAGLARLQGELAGAKSLADVAGVAARNGADEIGGEALRLTREALLNKEGVKELTSVVSRGIRRTLEGISDPAKASPEQLEKAVQSLQKYGVGEADALRLAHAFHATGRSADEAALSARRFAEEAVLARSADRAYHPPARLVEAERRALAFEEKLAARREYEAAGGWMGKARASYNAWKLGNEEKGLLAKMNALRDSSGLAGEHAGRKWPGVIAKAERKAIASFITDTPGRGAAASSKLADAERFLSGISSKSMIVASNDPVVLRAAKARGFRTIGVFAEDDWLAHGQRASQAGRKYWDGLCDYCMGRSHWASLAGKGRNVQDEAWRSLADNAAVVRYHGTSQELGRHASQYLRDYWFKSNAVAKFTFSALDEAFEAGRKPDEGFTSQLRNALGYRLKGYAAVEDSAARAAAERRAYFSAARKTTASGADELAENAAYLLARHAQEGTPAAEIMTSLRSLGYKEPAVKAALGLVEMDQAAALHRLRHLPESVQKAVAGDVITGDGSLRQYAALLKGAREVDGVDVVAAMKQIGEDLARVGNERSAAAYEKAVAHAMAAGRAAQVGENLRMSVADLDRGLREVRAARPDISDADALAALEKKILERNPGRALRPFLEEDGSPSALGRLVLGGKSEGGDLKVTANGVDGAEALQGQAVREGRKRYRVQVFRASAEGEIGGRGTALHELWHVRNMRLGDQIDDFYKEARTGATDAARKAAGKKLVEATLGNFELKAGIEGLGAADLHRLRQAALESPASLHYQKDTGRAVLKASEPGGRELVYEARFARGLSGEEALAAMQRALDGEAERVRALDSYAYKRTLDEKQAIFYSAYGELRDGAEIARQPFDRGRAVEAKARLAYARRVGMFVETITRHDIDDLSAVRNSLADRSADVVYEGNGQVRVTAVRPDGSLVHLEGLVPQGLKKDEVIAHVSEALAAGVRSAEDTLVNDGTRKGRLALLQSRAATVAAGLEAGPQPGAGQLASGPRRAPVSQAMRELAQFERERDAFHLAAARRAYLASPESEAAARAYDRAVKRHGHVGTGAFTSDTGLSAGSRLSRALEEEGDFLAARAAAAGPEEARRLRGALGAVRARSAGLALEQAATRTPASVLERIRRGVAGVREELRQSYHRNARHFGNLDFDSVMRDPSHRRALTDFLAADKLQDASRARSHAGLRSLVGDVLRESGDTAPAPAKVARITRDLGALHARPVFEPGEAEALLRKKGWSDGEVRACRASGLCENMRAHLDKDRIAAPSVAREAELEARVPGRELRAPAPASPEKALRQLEEGLTARRKALAEELQAAPDAARKAAAGRELAAADERLAGLKDPERAGRLKELLRKEESFSLHGALVHPRTGEISAMGEELLKNPARKVAKDALVQPADGSAALVHVRDLLTAKGPAELAALFERAGLDSAKAKELAAHSLKGAGDLKGAEIYGRLRAMAKGVSALPAEQRFQAFRAIREATGRDAGKLASMRGPFLDSDRALAGSDPFRAGSAEQRVSDAILSEGKAWGRDDIALCRAIAACGFDAYSPKEVLARAAEAHATAKAEAATRTASRAPASEEALTNVGERRAYLEKKLDQIDAPWLKGELREDFLRAAERVELESSAAQLDRLAAAVEQAGKDSDGREIFLARYRNAADLLRADSRLSREEALNRGLDRVLQDVNGGTLSKEALEAERRNMLACLQSLNIG